MELPGMTQDAKSAYAPFDGASLHDLTVGIARGDEGAFDRFYAAYYAPLRHYLLLLSRGSGLETNDALQEAMIRVVRYIKPFRDAGDFWNWLRRLGRTAFLDQARKRSRTPLPLAACDAGADPSWDGDPTSVLAEHLDASLNLLSFEEKGLLRGKYHDGKSYETLALELGLTSKAVESRLARIRKKLKTLIMERIKNEQ